MMIFNHILSLNASLIHRSDVSEDGHSRAETKKWALSLSGEVSHRWIMYNIHLWVKEEPSELILFPHSPVKYLSLPCNPCRVFVLADPEVFSGSLGEVLLGDIEASASASGGFLSPLDLMRTVVQHSIQAALGSEQCHGLKLAQALKVSETIQYYLVLLSYPLHFLVLWLFFRITAVSIAVVFTAIMFCCSLRSRQGFLNSQCTELW